MLWTSHNMVEVTEVCDRVLFLHNGVITRDETLRDATRIVIAVTLLEGSFDPATIAAVTGIAPEGNVLTATVATDQQTADLVARIVGAGAGVVDVRRRTADQRRSCPHA